MGLGRGAGHDRGRERRQAEPSEPLQGPRLGTPRDHLQQLVRLYPPQQRRRGLCGTPAECQPRLRRAGPRIVRQHGLQRECLLDSTSKPA